MAGPLAGPWGSAAGFWLPGSAAREPSVLSEDSSAFPVLRTRGASPRLWCPPRGHRHRRQGCRSQGRAGPALQQRVSAPRAPLRPPWLPVSSLTTQDTPAGVQQRAGLRAGRGVPLHGAQAAHLRAVRGTTRRSAEGRRGSTTQGSTCSRLSAPAPGSPPSQGRPEELGGQPSTPPTPDQRPSLTLRGTPFPTQRGVVAGTGSRQQTAGGLPGRHGSGHTHT